MLANTLLHVNDLIDTSVQRDLYRWFVEDDYHEQRNAVSWLVCGLVASAVFFLMLALMG